MSYVSVNGLSEKLFLVIELNKIYKKYFLHNFFIMFAVKTEIFCIFIN